MMGSCIVSAIEDKELGGGGGGGGGIIEVIIQAS
jgi:hypothetical protein